MLLGIHAFFVYCEACYFIKLLLILVCLSPPAFQIAAFYLRVCVCELANDTSRWVPSRLRRFVKRVLNSPQRRIGCRIAVSILESCRAIATFNLQDDDDSRAVEMGFENGIV